MPTRIDLGRVIPGVVLILVALAVFAVLLGVAVLAFLFFFVPGSGDILRAALGLLVVPLVIFVAGVLAVATGVSWWRPGGRGWFSGVARARAAEDRMHLGQRIGELVGVGISLLIISFLYANQARGVAFFAPSFGPSAEFYFYGPAITGMVLSVARAVLGRRNALRPLDAVQALFFAAASFWLFSVFPFDFTHLADLFPSSIAFMFAWIPNWLGRALFLFAGLASLLNCAYTIAMFARVRARLAFGTGAVAS
jgi:hypothetical protein